MDRVIKVTELRFNIDYNIESERMKGLMEEYISEKNSEVVGHIIAAIIIMVLCYILLYGIGVVEFLAAMIVDSDIISYVMTAVVSFVFGCCASCITIESTKADMDKYYLYNKMLHELKDIPIGKEMFKKCIQQRYLLIDNTYAKICDILMNQDIFATFLVIDDENNVFLNIGHNNGSYEHITKIKIALEVPDGIDECELMVSLTEIEIIDKSITFMKPRMAY